MERVKHDAATKDAANLHLLSKNREFERKIEDMQAQLKQAQDGLAPLQARVM